ncbi:MAG TPA: hypothetical protein PLL77_14235 [Pyrinomonadaceae bacterium]|nr:hypothetical protein [Pyrinomonadaceae bacterium]
MMRKGLIVSIGVILLFCGTSFAQTTNDESIVGTFNGEEYSNEALGFTFKTPLKWYLPTKDQITKYIGKEVNKYEKIEFVISKKKIDAPENTVLGYSLMKQPSSQITARMVAESTKVYFLKNPDFRLTKDIATERLGGREFVTFEMGFISFPKQSVRIYMIMSDVYLITFALTYWDNDGLKEMMDSLNTIKFQSK